MFKQERENQVAPEDDSLLLDHQKRGLSHSDILRHSVAVILFLFSWRFLEDWYYAENLRSGIFCIILIVAALGVGAIKFFRQLNLRMSTGRILIVALLLLLLLPWGEWFQLNFKTSRSDWTRKLFVSSIFCYVLFSFLSNFRSIGASIERTAASLLTKLSERKISLWLPLTFAIFCSLISVFVFKQTPLTQDSAAHLFQAKIFSIGRLYAPEPPFPEFFSYQGDMLVMKDGKWFSMYAPGFSFLLAVAMSMNAEFFLCPILGAFTLYFWIRYIERWHNKKLAAIFALLFILSPFLFLMSSTPMVHVMELFLVSAFFYVARSAIDEPRFTQLPWFLLIFTAAILTRAFSILPLIAPVLCFFVYKQWNRRKSLHIVAIFFGFILGVGLLAAYQHYTTGSAILSGYKIEYPDLHFGFGRTMSGEIHTPARGLENLSNFLNGLNVWVTGSPAGIVPFLLLFVLLQPKFSLWDLLFAGGCALLASFYFFFAAPDLVIGPRYVYVLTPILLLFVVRSVSLDVDVRQSEYPLAAFLVVSFVFYLMVGFTDVIQRYNPKFTQTGYLKNELSKVRSKSVVFLGSRIHQNFVNWNDPFLNKNTVISRDKGDRNHALLSAFQGYQPLYFELVVNAVRNQRAGYHFTNSYSYAPPLTFFELAALISNSIEGDQDLLDSFYSDYVESDLKGALDFVYRESKKREADPSIQGHYRRGLIYTAQLILEPRVWSLEHKGSRLPRPIITRFRTNYDHAVQQWSSSGELGIVMMNAFQKVRARIDQNKDRIFSEQEIEYFLRKKLRVPY